MIAINEFFYLQLYKFILIYKSSQMDQFVSYNDMHEN